jgi:hypothetical protein
LMCLILFAFEALSNLVLLRVQAMLLNYNFKKFNAY